MSKRKDVPCATKRPFLGSSGRGGLPATMSTREAHCWRCGNPGTTTALVVPLYQPSTPQGLGHQSSMETYTHNFFYIGRGVDNDFISDYRSSSSTDNDHMEAEKYVDNLGLFEESHDDIRADYISPDGKSNNNTETPNVKGRLASHLPFWKSIGASDFILQVIEKGYALPFISEPKPAVFSNKKVCKGQQGIRNL